MASGVLVWVEWVKIRVTKNSKRKKKGKRKKSKKKRYVYVDLSTRNTDTWRVVFQGGGTVPPTPPLLPRGPSNMFMVL